MTMGQRMVKESDSVAPPGTYRALMLTCVQDIKKRTGALEKDLAGVILEQENHKESLSEIRELLPPDLGFRLSRIEQGHDKTQRAVTKLQGQAIAAATRSRTLWVSACAVGSVLAVIIPLAMKAWESLFNFIQRLGG